MKILCNPTNRIGGLAAALGAVALTLAAGSQPAAGAALPATIPGLPQESVTPATRVAAVTAQGDREFLQQMEGGAPSERQPGPAPVEEAPRDASSPTLAPLGSGIPELKSAGTVAEQPSPRAQEPAEAALAPVTPQLAPAPIASKSARRDSGTRDLRDADAASTAEPRATVTTRRLSRSFVAPTETDVADEGAPVQPGGFQAPVTRTRVVTTVTPAAPYPYRYDGEADAAEPEYIEVQPRHHGFFHRLFHHHD
jgi:hypothetical protein